MSTSDFCIYKIKWNLFLKKYRTWSQYQYLSFSLLRYLETCFSCDVAKYNSPLLALSYLGAQALGKNFSPDKLRLTMEQVLPEAEPTHSSITQTQSTWVEEYTKHVSAEG